MLCTLISLPIAASGETSSLPHQWHPSLDPRYNLDLRGLTNDARILVEGRLASGVMYFEKLDYAINREIVTYGSKLSVINTESDNERKLRALLRSEQSARHMSQVAISYRKALKQSPDLAGERSIRLPFGFLGADEFSQGLSWKRDGNPHAMSNLRSGYEKNPSTVKATIYLELALIELETNSSNAIATLELAVQTLDLTNMNFKSDIEFRLRTDRYSNIARPEAAILFIAGRELESTDLQRAIHYYRSLVRGAPGSPLSWEAAARMSYLKSTGEIVPGYEQVHELLANGYPLVWGVPRNIKRIEKEKFSQVIIEMLKEIPTDVLRER